VRKNVWAWVVTPVIGICVLAIPVWGDLRPGQATPFSYLPWLTPALIAVGIVYMLVLQAVRPQVMGTRRRCSKETRAPPAAADPAGDADRPSVPRRAGHLGEAAGKELPFGIVVREGQGVTVGLCRFGLVAKAP